MIASVTCLLLCHALAAQSPPATQPTHPAATQPAAAAPLLSGPSAVEDDAGKLTIVRRSFDGSVENLGADPDAAAIAMLDLTVEQKARFDEVRAARTTAFDQIVRNNYGLMIELSTLQGETNAARRFEVLTKTQEAFKPYLERESFLREMWPALTDAQRQQVEAMVAEYRQARTDALDRETGKQLTRRQVVLRERLAIFGMMVRESIERQIGLERDNFEALANQLELTAEQRTAAETIFGPLTVKRFQNIEVTPAERSAAFAEFNKVLTAGQKQKVLGILLRQYRSSGGNAPASQPAPASPAATQPHMQ